MVRSSFKLTIGVSLLAGIVLLVACRYYKPMPATVSDRTSNSEVLHQYVVDNKYFVLRHPSGNYAMGDIRIDEKAQSLTCMLSTLPAKHTLYVNSKPRQYRFVKAKGEDAVLREVHVYVKGSERPDSTSAFSIPITDIQKIEVIEFDKGRTTTSYVLGVAIPVAAAVAIIAIASSNDEPTPPPSSSGQSSCPFISVFDGESYVVQGESYGGAIYPSLERVDYLPVQAAPVNGVYQMRISNELQEVQHTNLAKLMVIRHDKSVRALADESGKIYTIGATMAPARAVLNGRLDVTTSVAAPDQSFCSFNDTSAPGPGHSLVVRFSNPGGAKEAKLLLHIKNSFLLDRLYDKLAMGFGGYYPQWVSSQEKRSAASLEKQFRDQYIPLTVSVKTMNGWQKVRELKSIGPLAFRDVVVPLDLEGSAGSEVEVQLSTGFGFWDVDYAGIDYTPQRPVSVQTLSPFYARDENDRDVLPSLLYDDQRYLDQPQPGNAAVLKFRSDEPLTDGRATSVILETQGYYDHVRSYKGVPNLSLLRKLRQPGGFSAVSRQQYIQAYASNRTLATVR